MGHVNSYEEYELLLRKAIENNGDEELYGFQIDAFITANNLSVDWNITEEDVITDMKSIISEETTIEEKPLRDYKTIDAFSERVSDLGKIILGSAKKMITEIENDLYLAPGFFQLLHKNVSEDVLQAVFTDEQKKQLANGTLKLLTKKDGSLLATLINPETKKMVAQVPLKSVSFDPVIGQKMMLFSSQMQMAQISKDVQAVQEAIEEVRKDLENDRLATAYSLREKYFQAILIKNPELRSYALLRLAQDAEDSRNLLMLSQKENAGFIANQPEGLWKKVLNGADKDEINKRMNELRSSVYATNMVSLISAMSYQQLGEFQAAKKSLDYYCSHIQNTYLYSNSFLERLDMLDPSKKPYWRFEMPQLIRNIKALPVIEQSYLEMEE